MSMRLMEMKQERHAALNAADAIVAKAEADGKRQLTAEETKLFDVHMAEVEHLNARIKPIEAQNTIFKMFNGTPFLDGGVRPAKTKAPLVNGAPVPAVDLERFNVELGDFMRGTITASDTPVFIGTGGGVESVGATVPTEVLAYVPAYYNLDSFALAGARQINTDNTIPLVLPVVSGGAAASTYNEGAAPTNSQPFQMDSFTFHGTKYSRLVKVSDEALMNSAIPLQGAILDELTAGISTTFTGAVTTALLAALAANSGVLVAEGANDIYKTLGSVMHSIPPRWAAPTNAWMLSRTTLAKIKDQRASTSGVPLFDPTTNQVFSKNVVINDNLTGGQVVFGNWESGAIIRKSPFYLFPMREAFASSGEVGFRATQWLDQHFLCELSDVPNQPLYYTVLA